MASRIFSPQRFGSSLNPGSASTHWYRSVKRTCFGSTSGWLSTSAIAISWVSVHFIPASIKNRDGPPLFFAAAFALVVDSVFRDLDHEIFAGDFRLAGEARGG